MLSLRKPRREEIQKFLDRQSRLDFSYSFVGQTASTPPANFSVDHTRVKLGSGEAVFLAATLAIQQWEQFRLGWVEAWSPETPIKSGEVVGVMGHVIGLWWLNACRIVYVVDEGGPVQRFGFAYGTLPGHVESGEERFMIEWDRAENSVWYDILAFSRPRHLLAWLGSPFARLMQKRFARDSAKAMVRFVGTDSHR